MIEVDLDVLAAAAIRGATVVLALDRMELHVEQPRGVVGALEEAADAQEVERLVLQHRAHRDAARQVRAELDPFEGRARVLLERTGGDHALELEPRLVLRLPHLGGQRAAHRSRVLARGHEAAADARRVVRVGHHVVHHVARRDRTVALREVAGPVDDGVDGLAALLR